LGLQFILEGAQRKEPGLIFTLEESPEQLEATADALGLALRKWIAKGLVEIVYISPGRVRSAQFLTIFGDRIRGLKARRVLLDGVTYMDPRSEGSDGLRQLLSKLVTSFKRLDVTSLLTAESKSLYFGDHLTEGGFSPVADNLLLLRYVPIDDQLTSAIRIMKTRGSAHDRGTHSFHLGRGGGRIMRDAPRSGAQRASSAKISPARKSPTKDRPR
jgi:circadian clock protein KaiC